MTDVMTYYLEMTDVGQLRPKKLANNSFEVIKAAEPIPELSRFLYTAVGGDWYWIDRLPWSYDCWREWIDRPELQTWVGYLSGTPAGYFELQADHDANVEIASFGLIPAFIGKGLGSHLLTEAVEQAWRNDASRIWLHTCTLDHPSALKNYLARGFTLSRQEKNAIHLPAHPPGPWPGANR